jgi:hypothetical protein
MVATNCWPLGRKMPTMTIEMVHLLVFSEGVRVPISGSVFNGRRVGLLRSL